MQQTCIKTASVIIPAAAFFSTYHQNETPNQIHVAGPINGHDEYGLFSLHVYFANAETQDEIPAVLKQENEQIFASFFTKNQEIALNNLKIYWITINNLHKHAKKPVSSEPLDPAMVEKIDVLLALNKCNITNIMPLPNVCPPHHVIANGALVF